MRKWHSIAIVVNLWFAANCNAANLIKPRFIIEHNQPIRISKVSDLAGHIRENHNNARFSLGELIGTAIEIKRNIYEPSRLITVQWHQERSLISIRMDFAHDIVLINPHEHGNLSKLFSYKADHVAGMSVEDILKAFD